MPEKPTGVTGRDVEQIDDQQVAGLGAGDSNGPVSGCARVRSMSRTSAGSSLFVDLRIEEVVRLDDELFARLHR